MIPPGNTKGGSITVPLTSCLTGLESTVWLLKMFVFICKTDQSKPVKQEVNGTAILPPLVFPDTTNSVAPYGIELLLLMTNGLAYCANSKKLQFLQKVLLHRRRDCSSTAESRIFPFSYWLLAFWSKNILPKDVWSTHTDHQKDFLTKWQGVIVISNNW